ncbi:EMI domain-containing protein 1 [Chelonia mydas]|uniref:EMI domain-containing protein 1 n=1 Tax=Chelonia mydas TaxID=8469 RepID=M7AR83_CHEMY|nr:EMI domain-containing protein 1 [Chelonia mydas]
MVLININPLETISYVAPQEAGRPAPLRRLPLRPATYSGCLNCSKVVELTARLSSLEAKAPLVRRGRMVQGASPERRDFRVFQGLRDPQAPLPQWGLQYPALLTQGTRFCQTPSLNLTALALWGLQDPQGLQGQWVLWAPQGQLGYQALRGAMGYPERQVLTEPPVPQGRKETDMISELCELDSLNGWAARSQPFDGDPVVSVGSPLHAESVDDNSSVCLEPDGWDSS